MDLRKLRDKATEAFSKGRFSKAAELYAEYCEKDPKDIQAKLRMGDAYAKSGDRAKAIAAYKAAAEAFAKEGFLPRAIAASKLILELDPSHTGVQQMLANLYARKGGGPGPRRPTTQVELPAMGGAAARPKREPIELPKDDEAPAPNQPEPAPAALSPPPPPPSKYAPIELDGADEELSVATTGASPASAQPLPSELPPELEIITEPAAPPPPPAANTAPVPGEIVLELDTGGDAHVEEIPIDEPLTAPASAAQPTPPPASAPSVGPPGLKRRPTAVELPAIEAPPPPPEATMTPVPAVSVPQAATPVPLPAPSGPPATASAAASARASPAPLPPAVPLPAAPRNEVTAAGNDAVARPASRIYIPGSEPSAPAPVVAPPGAGPAAKASSDLERALSRFDELSLDDAPPSAATPEPAAPAPTATPAPASPAPTPARVPSFTELELEGDSLLHAVEVAAIAGKTQRGEAPAEEEEEVFSLTAEVTPEQKDAGELPKIPLFSDLPPDAFIELFERCPLKRFGPGERIVAQGSVGDAFYVVCEGTVRVVRDELDGPRELATLNEGTFFGEMALLSGAARSASVDSASDDTQVLEISAPVLAQLSVRYPSVASALKKFCRQRMLSNVMNTSALFRPFTKSERRTLVEKFRARDVNKGDVVIKEGAQTDGLYIVLSGEVEVLRGAQVLARLHEGEIFGEMSLLKKAAASADVRASRRTSLIRLPRADFDALILSHPQILVLISELTDDRQRQNEAVAAGEAEIGEQGLMLV